MGTHGRDLLTRLNKFKGIDLITGCWRFLGSQDGRGYGQMNINKKIIKVHRLSASIFLNYNLNSHLQINHKKECKYRDCWNPDHLYIGTQSQNVNDMRNEDFFSCGHERSIYNTILKIGVNGYKRRICRFCRDSRNAKRYIK
jgi:hypothetical protein